MDNFSYYSPTRYVFGKDTEMEVGKLVKESGAKNMLLHFGGQSAEKSGLISKIREQLTKADILYTELGGVVPNPRTDLVYEGIEICKKSNIDMVL